MLPSVGMENLQYGLDMDIGTEKSRRQEVTINNWGGGGVDLIATKNIGGIWT